ncbi:MAG TPA: HAMP domain-containing histidine kinase [Gammaproteobacteria bacterium]|nr:HAMP domain-containing histidine kinase [Gammaproteobacteria bacterium]
MPDKQINSIQLSDRYTWLPLWLLNLYRLILSGLFLSLFQLGPIPTMLGRHDAPLFLATSLSYFGVSILFSITIHQRKPGFENQAHAQVFTDIVALTLLMHASGGITSGLGLLLVAVIAGAGIVLTGRLAFLHAAFASIAVLGEQIFADLSDSFFTTAYTQAGILGTLFFATALLAHILARQARDSEALARQRSIDLASLEQLNDYVVRNVQSGVLVVDNNMLVRLINPSAWKLLGRPDIQPHQSLASALPELSSLLNIWKKQPANTSYRLHQHDHTAELLIRFEQIGEKKPTGTIIYIESSSEIAQRAQQMKLASLGRVTAGIAHEIRNPLGAISHAAQLLAESEHLDKGDKRMIEIIRNHSTRMNSIIESVLQLSRRDTSIPKNILLSDWLHEFMDEFALIESLTEQQYNIQIDPVDTNIYFDPKHFHQLIWNLCRNAIEHGQGDSLNSFTLSLNGGYDRDQNQPYIDIQDNGPGVDDSRVNEIFEPFVTTQASGTGLGLYICRELCELNQARIEYVPVTSGGSCFRIFFYTMTKMEQN